MGAVQLRFPSPFKSLRERDQNSLWVREVEALMLVCVEVEIVPATVP